MFVFYGGWGTPSQPRTEQSVLSLRRPVNTYMVSQDNCVPSIKSIIVPCTRQDNSCYRLYKTALTVVNWLVIWLITFCDWIGYVKPNRTWASFLRVCQLRYRIQLPADGHDVVHEPTTCSTSGWVGHSLCSYRWRGDPKPARRLRGQLNRQRVGPCSAGF
jgi:hypothetical protein